MKYYIHNNKEELEQLIFSDSIIFSLLKKELLENIISKENQNELLHFKEILAEKLLSDRDIQLDKILKFLKTFSNPYHFGERVINRINDVVISSPEEITNFFYSSEFDSLVTIITPEQFQNLSDDVILLFYKALGNANFETQLKILHWLPDSMLEKLTDNIKFLIAYLQVIKEKWASLKQQLGYIVFDLETDMENNIRQFAFIQNGKAYSFDGEEQLTELFNAIENASIIIGHNIKEHDLPILYNKGLEKTVAAFIWDTLQIELLINPCRYSYSLQCKHNAEEDAEKAERLFWNQVRRLCDEQHYYQEIKQLLPEEFNAVFPDLCNDIYKGQWVESSYAKEEFFHGTLKLDKETVKKIKEIARHREKVLVVAPQEYWSRLAMFVPLQFPCCDNYEFRKLAKNRIESSLELKRHSFYQKILLRFCEKSETPILANLPLYLRIPGENKFAFSEEDIRIYLKEAESNIDCIDIGSFYKEKIQRNNYDYRVIFKIASVLEDRLHCEYIKEFSMEELLSKQCSIPWELERTDYVRVNDNEAKLLGIIRNPEVQANIWAERTENGKIAILRNFHYRSIVQKLSNRFSITTENVNWKFRGQTELQSKIELYYSNVHNEFDGKECRHTPNTMHRAAYWVYQFKILIDIQKKHNTLPVLHIISDSHKSEIKQLENYAKFLGFNVSIYGTWFRKMEYAGSMIKGYAVITKSEFRNNVWLYKTDTAFCYIWDNIDIERYRVVWNELPFKDDPRGDSDSIDLFPIEGDDDSVSNRLGKQCTEKDCLLATIPILQYYASIITVANSNSVLCVMEPCLDDYPKISDKFVEYQQAELWTDISKEASERIYRNELAVAERYFPKRHCREERFETQETLTNAMKTISNLLIDGNEWNEDQKKILPYILKKEGDCLVSIPTGGGKSVLFQGPAIYRGRTSHKLSIVVSPLKALMQDQVTSLNEKGFAYSVDYLNADRLYPEVKQIYRRIRSGNISLLYVTPERFRVDSFLKVLQQRMEFDNGLEYFIFDEAHCILQWGNEFRPDYHNALKLCLTYRTRYLAQNGGSFNIALFSATVSAEQEKKLSEYIKLTRLGQHPEDYAPLGNRISISFKQTIGKTRMENHESRFSAIKEYIFQQNINFEKSRMLIFCHRRDQCEDICAEFKKYFKDNAESFPLLDERMGYYHGRMDEIDRNEVYEQFRSDNPNSLCILFTTKAFGMGMDIPNVHYLVHYSPPAILEDYLQEVGRAGRDKKSLETVLGKGSQIPALCLVSAQDFNKLKTNLQSSLLAWSDLKKAKDSIKSYIGQFRSDEEAKYNPVVVPYSICSKNLGQLDDVSGHLIFYWLDKIKHIKLGMLKPAHIGLALKTNSFSKDKFLAPYGELYNTLYKFIGETDKSVQIPIEDIRKKLRRSISFIINGLLSLMARGVLELHEEAHCTLTVQRYGETLYMIQENDNEFALHIIFEATRNILRTYCTTHSNQAEIEITNEHRKEIEKKLRELLENIQNSKTYKEEFQDKQKHTNTNEFMIWKKKLSELLPEKTVTHWVTFRNKILTKGIRLIFLIISMIPNVDFRDDKTVQQIYLHNKKWESDLFDMEEDCLKVIKYVANVNRDPSIFISFNWATALIREFNFDPDKKNFTYFQSIFDLLRRMGYIYCTRFLSGGIEVTYTDNTLKEIDEGLSDKSELYLERKEFNEQEWMKKVRYACMEAFSLITKEKQEEFITNYFKCADVNDYLELLEQNNDNESMKEVLNKLQEKALEEKEMEMKNNKFQYEIYNYDINKDINVLAGPGSGKTHVLTMRCARLVCRENIQPQRIMVLAYNRAVVVELKNRLNKLFTDIGLHRYAQRLHIYTFHGIIKAFIPEELDEKTNKWEEVFLQKLKTEQWIVKFKTKFSSDIAYIMVDEFQDVTPERLNVLLELHKIYPDAKFFTIGDKNQSIYGYERVDGKELNDEMYAEYLSPDKYYNELHDNLNPVELSMNINYRSYPAILNYAKKYIQGEKDSSIPEACEDLKNFEKNIPTDKIIQEYNIYDHPNSKWDTDLTSFIEWAKNENLQAENLGERKRRIENIAILFRSNAEVFVGYSKLKDLIPEDVRIRIQGAETGAFWRRRECYVIINYLKKHEEKSFDINELCVFLRQISNLYSGWDKFYLKITYSLLLEFDELHRDDFTRPTFREAADFLTDISSSDDSGQIYKIYELYKHKLDKENKLTVILTTMHKVKGLEFDAVIITPSTSALPLKFENKSKNKIQAELKEERRLYFVACTRAKKCLIVYKDNREFALDEPRSCVAKGYPDNFIEKTEIEAIDIEFSYNNYKFYQYKNGSWQYSQYDWKNFNEFASFLINIPANEPVTIMRQQKGMYQFFNILCRNRVIGQLSDKALLPPKMKKSNINTITGLFIKEVLVWTFENSQKATLKANNPKKNYTNWEEEARNQGYVYIITLGGIGKGEK